MKATSVDSRDSLGVSAVDLARRAGTLATIYEDRVGRLAAEADIDRGRLLGLAIAHEIGHLLLGTADHAYSGLMRARWLSGELRHERPLDWMFSTLEGSGMRSRLVARSEATTER